MASIPDPTGSGSDTESTTSIPSPQTQSHHNPSPEQDQEQSIFPLAHPPPNKNPNPTQRLRLTPKLLLQIQHLSPKSTRPLPVLEVWLPSRFTGRLGVDLPKLRAGDVYITQSEGFTELSGDDHSYDLGVDGEGTGSQEGGAVVGVIYNSHVQKTKAKSKMEEAQAEVHFPLGGRTWIASTTASGGYRFHSQGGEHVLEWKRRGSGKGGQGRPMSGSSSSTDPAPGGEGRFVLGIVDVKTRRGPRVASLTRRGFKVGCWERLPRDALRGCVVASSTEVEAGAGLSEGKFRTAVYTMILTMGVWVASQEGWLG